MKKFRWMLVLALTIFCVALLTGCQSKETEEGSDSSISVDFVEVETIEDEHEGEARSMTTGEWVDESVAARRPVALMMSNDSYAQPQYGISDADIVYEAPMEGNITRLLLIYQRYPSADKIMSIRSSRHYFIYWALEYDAIYAHYGQSWIAKEELEAGIIDNLNGMEGVLANVTYFRDSSRSAPHNAYSDGSSLKAGIELKEYRKKHEDSYEGSWTFNEDDENEIEITDSEAEDAVVIVPGYYINKPWFVYDEETGSYKRYQYGEAELDANDNSELYYENVIIQLCDSSVLDSEHGYLEVENVGEGTGYYITNGKAVKVNWSKSDKSSKTVYTYEDGTEVVLNQGKTWINVVKTSDADRIAFYESEEAFEEAGGVD